MSNSSRFEPGFAVRTGMACVLSIILGISACNLLAREYQDDELSSLIESEMNLRCIMDSIRSAVKAEWDVVNEKLDRGVPETMPEEEKQNMLKVRNASLIRMFESYAGLDPGIQQAVDHAEEKDRFMAGRVSEINRQLRILEERRYAIFSEMEKKGQLVSVNEWKERYRAGLEDPCRQCKN